MELSLGSHHPYIFKRTNPFKTVNCQLQQRPSASQNIYKLLRTFGSTHRPEAAANAPGHNNKMIIALFHILNSRE